MESTPDKSVPDILTYVLASLEELGISVKDASIVMPVINDGLRYNYSVEDIIEMALARLRPTQIEMHANVEHIDLSFSTFIFEHFSPVVERLFDELGILLTKITLLPSTQVKGIAVKINDRMEPLVLHENADLSEAITTFYNILRRSVNQFLSIEDVEWRLAQLYESNPILIQETLMRFSIGDIARVLRGMIRQGLSILNLGAILERLLEYDTIPIDTNIFAVFDDRLAVAPERLSINAWSDYLAFVCKG